MLVEAFRPGVLARRGLGADELRRENPRLVYCSLTGYGQDGPLAARAGHDVDYIALGGLLGTSRDAEGAARDAGHPDRRHDGRRSWPPSASWPRSRRASATGRGQVVDVSMLEGVLSLMTIPATRPGSRAAPSRTS